MIAILGIESPGRADIKISRADASLSHRNTTGKMEDVVDRYMLLIILQLQVWDDDCLYTTASLYGNCENVQRGGFSAYNICLYCFCICPPHLPVVEKSLIDKDDRFI